MSNEIISNSYKYIIDTSYGINKDGFIAIGIIQQIKHCFIRQIKTGPAECLTMV